MNEALQVSQPSQGSRSPRQCCHSSPTWASLVRLVPLTRPASNIYRIIHWTWKTYSATLNSILFQWIGLIKGSFSLYTFLLTTTYFAFGSLLLGLRNARVQGNSVQHADLNVVNRKVRSTADQDLKYAYSFLATNSQPKAIPHILPRPFGNLF